MSGRTSTAVGDLARRGFSDASRAQQMVDAIVARHPACTDPDGLLDILAGAADPDLALQGISALDESATDLAGEIFIDEDWLVRLVTVLGGSQALNQFVRAHPGATQVIRTPPRRLKAADLRAAMLEAVVGAGSWADDLIVDDPAAPDRLRLANKYQLLRIATRDLCHPRPVEIVDDVAGELADLADAVMGLALACARSQVPGQEKTRLGVVGLGKCGARELNYLSDIDVLYVAEPADDQLGVEDAMQIGTKLAAAMTRVCSAHSGAGTIWQVDAALRPDGNAGPLVRTLASHRFYYEKWAKNWEFQAMLKARPMAGDLQLAQDFVDMVSPMVWQVGGQPNYMTETQAMRQRVVNLIPARERDREIKLGAGGLRDVEFSVQVLQLVHGRADERLRTTATLPSLARLVEHGYIGRADGTNLDESYRFMRVLEHREQLFRLRRTHLMPDDPTDLRRLARQMGLDDGEKLWDLWRHVARHVKRLQQRVFYSPLLEAVSKLSSDELKLSPEAASDRLRALGFSDPRAALRHIEALTTGLNRTAEIQRQLMPAMLGWFSDGPNPDLGLLSFRRLSEEMSSTSWYMRALRDEGWMAERLAKILSTSRYISDLLRRDPAVAQLLVSDEISKPRSREDLNDSMLKIVERHSESPEPAINAVRSLRLRELFRLAAGDVLGTMELADVGRGLSELTGASVDAALRIAMGADGPRVPIGIVAMGSWGGGEMGYSSDGDAMFVVGDECEPDDLAWAEKVIARMRALLWGPGPEPALVIDADLRPDGRNGPMVRRLGSYLSYYRRWSDTWESQALLRASFGAGDRELVDRLLEGITFRRYPADGINPTQVAAIRQLKGRMERERTRRGAATENLKLGPGGLSDIEWTVQLLQLQHAGQMPKLRVPGTQDALEVARKTMLISDTDAEALSVAWQLASQLRNKAMLVRGRPSDLLPSDPRETASVATLLGYEHAQASQLMDAWAKAARHASQVVGRLFWGLNR